MIISHILVKGLIMMTYSTNLLIQTHSLTMMGKVHIHLILMGMIKILLMGNRTKIKKNLKITKMMKVKKRIKTRPMENPKAKVRVKIFQEMILHHKVAQKFMIMKMI